MDADDWDFEPDDCGPEVEHERLIANREPYTFHDERDNAACADFMGDHHELGHYAGRDRRRRDHDEWFWDNRGVGKPLTRGDLEAMRSLDAETDCPEDQCEEYDDWPGESRSLEELRRLWAIGRRLHKRDSTFWRHLRRLGPTPSLVTQANELLFPNGIPSYPTSNVAVGVRVHRRRADLCQARGGGRRRSRTTRRRAVRSSARSGDSGDGPEGEPAGPRLAGARGSRHVHARAIPARGRFSLTSPHPAFSGGSQSSLVIGGAPNRRTAASAPSITASRAPCALRWSLTASATRIPTGHPGGGASK